MLAYFGIRTALRDDAALANTVTESLSVEDVESVKESEIPRVVTRTLRTETHPIFLNLKGRTTPNRTVIVKSGTTGGVIEAPPVEGRNVREGALLCRLAVDARQANVAEAEAILIAQNEELKAATRLVEKGLAPNNRLNRAKADRDAAEAALDAAKIELSRTEIRAPFAGVFETRMAERGDFLSPGAACGMIADLNPIRIEAEVTEEYAIALKQGAPVSVSVLGAPAREGQISYVARTSNAATRTFKIEASLDNQRGEISAGLTSDLRIQLGETNATAISPALLTLHDDGRLGVRHVTPDGLVAFSEVNVIDDTENRIWVTGLPDEAVIVSVGQEYISAGVRVEAVPETGSQP